MSERAVLISIQPKWVEKIASGEKTIEVRKSVPKLERPFKVYIYETQGKQVEHLNGCDITYHGRGKVIGEFVCDSVEMVNAGCSDYGIDLFYHDCMTKGCLTESEVDKYFNIPEDKDLRAMKGNGYAWHISQLKIYEKPKELREFTKYMDCKNTYDCCACHNWDRLDLKCIAMNNEVKRPPQSWCYVEPLKENADD